MVHGRCAMLVAFVRIGCLPCHVIAYAQAILVLQIMQNLCVNAIRRWLQKAGLER